MIYSEATGMHRTFTEKVIPHIKYTTAAFGILLFTFWAGMIWYAASHHLLPGTNDPSISRKTGGSEAASDAKNAASKSSDKSKSGSTKTNGSTAAAPAGAASASGSAGSTAAAAGSAATGAVSGATGAVGGLGGGSGISVSPPSTGGLGGGVGSTPLPSGTPSVPAVTVPTIPSPPPCLCQTVNGAVNTVKDTANQVVSPVQNLVPSSLPSTPSLLP